MENTNKNTASNKISKILAGIVIAVASVLLAWLMSVLGALATTNGNLSHNLYHGRELADDIVIIAIEENSFLEPEQGGLGSFQNWNRSYYAEVIENVQAGDPSAVMVDVLFTSASDSIHTREIVQTALDYPQIEDFSLEILQYIEDPHPYDAALAGTLSEYDNVYLIKSVAGEGDFDGESFIYPDELLPFELFADAAETGYANVTTADDSENLGTIYSVPLYFTVDDGSGAAMKEEHMDLKLAREHLEQAGEIGEGRSLGIPVEKGQMIINYAAEPYSFPMYAFADAYYGRIDPEVFEEKIVLVGSTAAILQDRHFTPIDQITPMPGIEIHANAIQTILDGAFLQRQDLGGFLTVTGMMVLAIVGASLYLPLLAGGLVLIAEVIFFPGYAQWNFDRGVIVDLIWPIFAALVAYLAVLVYRNFTEFREKRKLKTAFGHYVSKDLVEQIAASPEALKLGGERRELSVMFLDLENFTHMSESMEAQDVVHVINTYFDALAKVIMENGGTVDKFEGDAIMALFGAPLPSQDHALQACRTALAVAKKMNELNAQMSKSTGVSLNIRVGIASGPAVVGNMGSQERFDYTAMGDTVNTASRLEGGNKFYGTHILMNSAAMKAGEKEFVFRRIDRVRLKGKDEPVDLFEPVGAVAEVSEGHKNALGVWHQAIEYYRNQQWAEAEARMQEVLKALPEDGPVKTYLTRMENLKKAAAAGQMNGWDGVWRFDSK
jgi:class 3 adenylate cyclase/CHASE2 domain-containing sensor protein